MKRDITVPEWIDEGGLSGAQATTMRVGPVEYSGRGAKPANNSGFASSSGVLARAGATGTAARTISSMGRIPAIGSFENANAVATAPTSRPPM